MEGSGKGYKSQLGSKVMGGYRAGRGKESYVKWDRQITEERDE